MREDTTGVTWEILFPIKPGTKFVFVHYSDRSEARYMRNGSQNKC